MQKRRKTVAKKAKKRAPRVALLGAQAAATMVSMQTYKRNIVESLGYEILQKPILLSLPMQKGD